MKLKTNILKRIEAISIEDSILSIREILFEYVLTILIVFGLLCVIVGGLEVYLQGKWKILFVYLCAYLPVLICFLFRREIQYRYRVIIVLFDFYLLSILILIGVGLSGAGIPLLITFSVLATTFLGIRMGLISILMSLIGILLIGLGMSSGALSIDVIAMTNSTRIEAWLMASTLFLIIGSIMVVCPGLLQNSLQRTIGIIQEKNVELQNSNEQFKNALKGKNEAEESLRENEAKFRLIFEHAPLGILHFDNKGIITACNDNFVNIVGSSKELLIGLSMLGLPEKNIVHTLEKTLNGSTARYEGEYNSMTAKKSTPIRLLFSPIFSKGGGVESGIGIIEDITDHIQADHEKEKLRTQLQQAQKMETIGTLAGGIAHDFNNILFPIMGYTEMLMEDTPEDSPFRNSLNKIYSGALRAKDLIKQILTFSRQERSELTLMKMQPIVNEILKLIRSSIPTTIDIKQEIQATCGVIKADPTQIHQVIMNLTTNAYHAMQDIGGELRVSLKEIEIGEYDVISSGMIPGDYACLKVVDTGVGMDKDLTKKIFDPFFTTKEKGKGTGMGLSVVHGIVSSMGGAIQVYSEPGKGTEFSIYIPVEKQVFGNHKIPVKQSIQGGSEKILLIDDEEDIVTMEKQMLERLGYIVTSRTSSIEALEAFRFEPEKFDLVITDMTMPGLPGDKLSSELTQIRSDIPVLLCTGFSENMSEEKAASFGIKGFLMKPIVMKDLAQKIRSVLDRGKGTTEQ